MPKDNVLSQQTSIATMATCQRGGWVSNGYTPQSNAFTRNIFCTIIVFYIWMQYPLDEEIPQMTKILEETPWRETKASELYSLAFLFSREIFLDKWNTEGWLPARIYATAVLILTEVEMLWDHLLEIHNISRKFNTSLFRIVCFVV